jgi:mRNA interferase MazF
VWWVNFDPQVGREQRPAVVVGSAFACESISCGRLLKQHSARLDKSEIEAVRFVLRRLIEV